MYTYIIVDDEMLTRKGTIKKLEPLKEQIICAGEAENGEEALKLIEQVMPNILITDMYMPTMDGCDLLKRVREVYPDIHIIVISGYKDFLYAKTAIEANVINYILKPFGREEIQSAILRAVELLDNSKSNEIKLASLKDEEQKTKFYYDLNMIQSVILGYNSTNFELTSEKLKIIEKMHRSVLLTIHSTKVFDNSKLCDYALTIGHGDLSIFIPHPNNKFIGFLLLFFPIPLPQKLDIYLKDICKGIIELLRDNTVCLSIGISSPKENLIQLNEAFAETVQALNQRRYNEKDCFYFCIKEDSSEKPVIWENEDLFLFRVEASEKEEVGTLLEDLFEVFQNKEECTLLEAKFYCADLCQKTKSLYSQYNDTLKGQENSQSVQRIFSVIFHFDELKEYLIRFFTNISLSMKINSVYAIDDVTEKMKIYIERNYRKDVTIEFVSSLFYLNRSYCSHLFKKKTGVNFADYLTRIRIERACYLLKETDQIIYQISKAVGYNNIKYFFRVFKKVTSKTPEQYRTMNKVRSTD